MHPLSTALFLLGYALALPIASRLPTIVGRQQRLAILGHQFGVLLAAMGWLLRGQVMVAVLHGIWLAIVYGWFEIAAGRSRSRSKVKPKSKS